MDDYSDYIEMDFAMDRHWQYDEDYDNGYEPFGPITTKTCKYCGKTNLRWILHEDKWRLISNEDGKIHECIEYDKGSALQEGKISDLYRSSE